MDKRDVAADHYRSPDLVSCYRPTHVIFPTELVSFRGVYLIEHGDRKGELGIRCAAVEHPSQVTDGHPASARATNSTGRHQVKKGNTIQHRYFC